MRLAVFTLALTIIHATAFAQQPQTPSAPVLTLDVDASQVPLKILHASMSMPARAGDMTLFYPKWIPGEHMASGPIWNLTGLHIFGREIDWRRDLVEMNAFRVTVPAGARTLSAKYDYVVPTGGGSFGTSSSTNAKCAVINWYAVVLYPMGADPNAVMVATTLKKPSGWKHGGSLDVARVDGDIVRYATTSLTELNEHPVVLGEHFRSIVLWPAGSDVGDHVIDAIADSEWALQFTQSRIEAYKRLVRQERADEFKRTIAGSIDRKDPFEFIVDNSGYFNVVKIDYDGGVKYPHLERVRGKDDVLTKIASPRLRP